MGLLLQHLEPGLRTLRSFLWTLWPPRQRLQGHVFTGDPGLIKQADYRASFSQVQQSVTRFMFMAVFLWDGSVAGWLEEPVAEIRHL